MITEKQTLDIVGSRMVFYLIKQRIGLGHILSATVFSSQKKSSYTVPAPHMYE